MLGRAPDFVGKGALQAIIDERPDDHQRAALKAVLHGEEIDQGASHWWVFGAMSSTIHEPPYAAIDFQCDIDGRTARAEIPGILEASGRPIKSPATGEEHRVRIDIPGGIEFDRAEIGSPSTKAKGTIALDLAANCGRFNIVRHSRTGPVR